ncbi:similar to Saccharomyces cerevisiae YNR035C ARC35 Subunit of the ARP2/3 complex, which is required for the motility and integrity of cortical actin patches [Maudiozyma saulgeensis]|uniref:Arp2/3 complex 34 kDa subunit n=1 Tax=Maudiozyma saulgeensis TaxID=1789683 RepID=A0A1X7R7K8_9SACH|nr:similar to Saccharomyces cerevisiae YNR035C ARC35 Subunit of the ARP2/3 complex, which is required for the motility and integrity of cortical actin patches [Kazachstania saulgeensis]
MLHLQPSNLLIQKTFTEALEANSTGSPLTFDRIISDFDYTNFHVSNDPENKGLLFLSVKTKAWQSILTCDNGSQGVLPYLAAKYTKLPGITVAGGAEAGYDYTLAIDLSQLTYETIVQLSLLKTSIMSYPFFLAFQEFATLSANNPTTTTVTVGRFNEETGNVSSIDVSSTLYTIQYRDNENMFIKPSNDRITVIFETFFQDETDKVFGKVFLQEFVDARKRNRDIQSAPQVIFSTEPPLELQNHLPKGNEVGDEASKRFITFVLFPRHFANEELQFKTVSQLTLFRNYFHYHIKCSKAYMHSRMRYRVDTFVKVLNRAKVDEDEDESGGNSNETKRTITGRKMVY